MITISLSLHRFLLVYEFLTHTLYEMLKIKSRKNEISSKRLEVIMEIVKVKSHKVKINILRYILHILRSYLIVTANINNSCKKCAKTNLLLLIPYLYNCLRFHF